MGDYFRSGGTREKEMIRVKILQEIEMRIMIRTACLLALLATTGLSAMLEAQVGANAAEQQLFISVNRARRNAGLPALKWNDALAKAAKEHAGVMAQRGEAQHGFAGEPALASRVTQAGARFVWLSENVALGPRVEAIEAEFFRSPNHRANMLDSDMDSIGVGIVERGGQFFAVEDFSKAK